MSKGYLKKKDTKEIIVEGQKLTVKRLSFGESRAALKEAGELQTDAKGNVKGMNIDYTLLGILRSIKAIEDWDLTDENDNKLPITLKTFDEILDEEFVGSIIKEVSKAFPQPSEQEKK